MQVMHAGRYRALRIQSENAATRLPESGSSRMPWCGARLRHTPIADRRAQCWQRPRPDTDNDALPLNADAAVMAGTLRASETAQVTLAPGRGIYLVPGDRVSHRDGDSGRATVRDRRQGKSPLPQRRTANSC